MKEVFIKNMPMYSLEVLEVLEVMSDMWMESREGKLKEHILCSLINEKLNRMEDEY